MKIRPVWLQVTALGTWLSTIASDAAGAAPRVWVPMLAAAVVTSLPALFGMQVSDRLDRGYQAMARAFLTRPRDPRTPPRGLPVLHSVETVVPHRRHARHASR